MNCDVLLCVVCDDRAFTSEFQSSTFFLRFLFFTFHFSLFTFHFSRFLPVILVICYVKSYSLLLLVVLIPSLGVLHVEVPVGLKISTISSMQGFPRRRCTLRSGIVAIPPLLM